MCVWGGEGRGVIKAGLMQDSYLMSWWCKISFPGSSYIQRWSESRQVTQIDEANKSTRSIFHSPDGAWPAVKGLTGGVCIMCYLFVELSVETHTCVYSFRCPLGLHYRVRLLLFFGNVFIFFCLSFPQSSPRNTLPLRCCQNLTGLSSYEYMKMGLLLRHDEKLLLYRLRVYQFIPYIRVLYIRLSVIVDPCFMFRCRFSDRL